jgi:hypothetical protein
MGDVHALVKRAKTKFPQASGFDSGYRDFQFVTTTKPNPKPTELLFHGYQVLFSRVKTARA